MVVLLCILASFLNGKQYRTDEFGSYDAKFTWNFSVCTCIYNLHVLATYQFSSGVKIIFRSFRIAEENSVAHNVECRELYCVKVSIMMTFEVNKSHPKLYHLRRSGFKYKYIPLARTHARTHQVLQNLHELEIPVQDTCESLDIQMLSSTWNETDYRFDMGKMTNGARNEIR